MLFSSNFSIFFLFVIDVLLLLSQLLTAHARPLVRLAVVVVAVAQSWLLLPPLCLLAAPSFSLPIRPTDACLKTRFFLRRHRDLIFIFRTCSVSSF